ncbi:unnamed protein product, partial [Meganyctiphanes norvegica]
GEIGSDHDIIHVSPSRGDTSSDQPSEPDESPNAIPPEPPDAPLGEELKVNGAVIRRMPYCGASGKHALRQQARRRRRNTSIAAGNSPPITWMTMKTALAATSPVSPASLALNASCSPTASAPTATTSSTMNRTPLKHVTTSAKTPSPPATR